MNPPLGNDHFFNDSCSVALFHVGGRAVRITRMHLRCVFIFTAHVCLFVALGGNFVDDDMLQSPFLTRIERFDVSALRIASVAIPVPLAWELFGDMHHLLSRRLDWLGYGMDGDDAGDNEACRRMLTVCQKEWALRGAFLLALVLPSAVLLFKNPQASATAYAVVPYMTSFCRSITLFCATTGYMSDLFDVSWHAKAMSIASSVVFTLGLLLVFYARVDRSQGYFAWDDVGGVLGMVMAIVAAFVFVGRVLYHSAVIAWREVHSVQSAIRMEEYVFVCYATGAAFVVTTIMLCDFSHVDGRFLYDFINAYSMVVYHVVMIVGTMVAVLQCARALRSWTFDVRFASLTARVDRLDGMLNSKLVAISEAHAEMVRMAAGVRVRLHAPVDGGMVGEEEEEEEEGDEEAAVVEIRRPEEHVGAAAPLPLPARLARRSQMYEQLATGGPGGARPTTLIDALKGGDGGSAAERKALREMFGSSVGSDLEAKPVI